MNKDRFIGFIDWLIRMICYTIVLIAVSMIFKKTIYIDPAIYGFWALMVAIIMYILNKTIKPLLFWLTLPITGLTLGIFYPFLNLFVLKMVDWILGSHFEIHGIWVALLVAIIISITNIIMDAIIVKPITRKQNRQ